MSTVDLFRREPRARVFFAVLIQSSLGTGAAYVALLLIAYERYHSPWAISLVLVADLLPSMALGPIFGALADRWSRKSCAVAADVVRAVAFLGIALVDGFVPLLFFALLAGAGTALFTPATLASLPSLVTEQRLSPAVALYSAIADLGFAGGPAIGALVLAAAGPETIVVANAVTFGISAIVLAFLRFGGRTQEPSAELAATPSIWADTREGTRAVRRIAGLWPILAASGIALFFVGLVNVAELPFVTEDLDGSEAVFSAVAALTGVGILAGSLAGGGGGSAVTLRRRYLQGLGLMAAAFTLSGLAPVVGVVLVTFLASGFGNGYMLVHERLIILATVPDHLSGRVFGIKDALTAWAFAVAFAFGGLLISVFGARAVVLAAGVGGLVVTVAAWITLRRLFLGPVEVEAGGEANAAGRAASSSPGRAHVLARWRTSEHESDVVDG